MSISGKTKVIGILGHPVGHTASPAMHNAAFRSLNLDYVYIPLGVTPPYLGTAMHAIKAFDWVGVNVTIPFKESVIPFLDKLTPMAKKIGAVNTIINHDGQLIGYNTDGEGFMSALIEETQFNPADKNIAILGSGGSAKAIAFSLITQHPKQLHLINRTPDRAKQLQSQLKKHTPIPVSCSGADVLRDCHLIINTTPVGMTPDIDAMPVTQLDWVSPGQVVCDIIYNPLETNFLHRCRSKGATTVNGVGMLAGQGALAFQLFTGHHIPIQFFRNEVNKAVC